MCGIVGVLSRGTTGLSYVNMDVFKEMLLVNQVRGKHGTGIIYDDKKGKRHILKGDLDAGAFFKCENVPKTFSNVYQESRFIIGHNRHATKGKLSWENTHPFTEGHITLVHNGTLNSHKHLKDVEVDSHAICHAINELGDEEAIKKIDGAFALVWYDSFLKTVNFIRNNERPLYLIETFSAWYLSSELKLAEWIIDRNKGHITSSKMLEVGRLYTYDPSKQTLEDRDVELKKPLPKTTYYGGYTDKYNDWKADQGNTKWNHYPVNYVAPSASALPAPSVDTLIANNTNPKIGDVISFSPIGVSKTGRNTLFLEAMVDGPLSSPDIHVRFYANEEKRLEELSNFPTLSGRVIQIVQKTGKLDHVVVKDITIVATNQQQQPDEHTEIYDIWGNVVDDQLMLASAN